MRSALSLSFLTVAVIAVAACHPHEVPPALGDVCVVDGKVYRPGDSVPSRDTCNVCACQAGGVVACTAAACPPALDAGPAPGCFYGGKHHPPGARFKSTDGCNDCFCGTDGAVGCTKRACPDLKACQRTGCSGQVCSDQSVATTCEWQPQYACYGTATCARQADGRCGWTPTPELEACLKNPPAP